ncbi:MAG TPA: hypothetical protein VHJ20_04680 [Polyangia bacterium]|nr:hypothetical protein [Polyangia bacterium]
MSRRPRVSLVLSLSLASLSFVACGGGSDTPSGGGGSGGTTSAGGSGGSTATAGSGGAPGTGGTSATGGSSAGGSTATGGSGGSPGTGGASATGGAGGSGGSSNAGGSGGASGPPPTMSLGCNMSPQQNDSMKNFVKHEVEVTGVDQKFISMYPVNAGQQYSWTHRNYFLRLPTNYNPGTNYPLTIGMSGCGGTETVGSEGGYAPLGVTAGETQAIQVALSYVLSSAAANGDCGGAVFADDFVNSPDPAYLAAVIKDISAKYCIDPGKIFLSGYSSGAFEAITLGGTSSDLLRAYGIQIGGGLRIHHPTFSTHPIAAFYVVGLQDTENPIGPLSAPLHDSLGSAPGRDEVLTRNGCQGNATATWDADYPMCVKYTGCPEKYPVVWCAINSGHLPDAKDPAVGKYRYDGLWKFWSSLPAP